MSSSDEDSDGSNGRLSPLLLSTTPVKCDQITSSSSVLTTSTASSTISQKPLNGSGTKNKFRSLRNFTHSDMRRIKENKKREVNQLSNAKSDSVFIEEKVVKYMKNEKGPFQTSLTQFYSKDESPMYKTEQAILMKRPDPFDTEVTFVTPELSQNSEKRYFDRFLKKENLNRTIQQEKEEKKKRKTVSIPPFYAPVDLSKDGDKLCLHCGNIMTSCHDVIFGMYCISAVIQYYKNETDQAEDLVAKRIFINHYTNALKFDTYKKTGKLSVVEMVYPPVCLEQNSYEYAIYWIAWKKKGMWLDKNISKSDKSKSVPRSFYDH